MSDRDAEAATWFARMRASDAGTHRAAFEAWRADPENAEAYARAEEDWLLTAGVAPEYIAVHRKSAFKPAVSRAHWALAAAVILAVSLSFAWVMLGHRAGDAVVADNGTSEVVLDDGTRVTLLEGARIDARFNPSERQVRLAGGRARFTVAHDAARPFRVIAAGTETTALGTIFEVDLTGKRPVVLLVRGSVEVRATANPAAALRLLPGQRAAIDNGAPKLIEAAAGGELADKSGAAVTAPSTFLIADSLPLGAIIDRANRVNAAKIDVPDITVAGRLVSGRFDISNAPSLARKLAIALDLQVEEQPGIIILAPKRKT